MALKYNGSKYVFLGQPFSYMIILFQLEHLRLIVKLQVQGPNLELTLLSHVMQENPVHFARNPRLLCKKTPSTRTLT